MKYYIYTFVLLILGVLILSGCTSTKESTSRPPIKDIELGGGCTVKASAADCTASEICVAYMFQKNNYVFDSKEGNSCVDYSETITETYLGDCKVVPAEIVGCNKHNRDVPGEWDEATEKWVYTNNVEFRTQTIQPIGAICCTVG